MVKRHDLHRDIFRNRHNFGVFERGEVMATLAQTILTRFKKELWKYELAGDIKRSKYMRKKIEELELKIAQAR